MHLRSVRRGCSAFVFERIEPHVVLTLCPYSLPSCACAGCSAWSGLVDMAGDYGAGNRKHSRQAVLCIPLVFAAVVFQASAGHSMHQPLAVPAGVAVPRALMRGATAWRSGASSVWRTLYGSRQIRYGDFHNSCIMCDSCPPIFCRAATRARGTCSLSTRSPARCSRAPRSIASWDVSDAVASKWSLPVPCGRRHR